MLHDAQGRGLVPEQEVRRFWEERYCAGLMRLVLVGPQPLPELEALVRARFGAVRNLGAAVPAFPGAHSLARARKYREHDLFSLLPRVLFLGLGQNTDDHEALRVLAASHARAARAQMDTAHDTSCL